jgi:hypothetical protein
MAMFDDVTEEDKDPNALMNALNALRGKGSLSAKAKAPALSRAQLEYRDRAYANALKGDQIRGPQQAVEKPNEDWEDAKEIMSKFLMKMTGQLPKAEEQKAEPLFQAHAKPMLPAYGDPQVERDLQSEAKGLMQDEASNYGKPSAMPNQPRDPNKNRPPASFLQGKSGMDFGQNQFASPLPSQDHMSKVNGALRLPPIQAPQSVDMAKKKEPMVVTLDDPSYFAVDKPKAPSHNPFKDDPRFAPIGPEQDQGPQSQSMAAGDGMMPPAQGMGLNLPPMQQQEISPMSPVQAQQQQIDPNDPREMIKRYLAKQDGPESQRRDNGLAQMLQGNEQANSKLGLMALLLDSANKAGSINGKMASSDASNQYFAGLQQQNNRSGDMLSKDRVNEKKALDDKLKGMMFLAKQQQDDQKYKDDLGFRQKQLDQLTKYQTGQLENTAESNKQMNQYHNDMLTATNGNTAANNQYRQDMLDLKKNPVMPPMNDLQKAQAAKALAEAKAIEDKAKLPGAGIKSPAQDAVDRAFGKTYEEYVPGGGASTVRTNLNKLRSVRDMLDIEPNATGPGHKIVPDSILTYFGNKGPAMRDDVYSAVQGTLKAVLGGQYTEREGQGIMSRAFDPNQTPAENKKRLNQAIDQLEGMVKAKEEAINYYEKNGTLRGYKGNPGLSQTPQTENKIQQPPEAAPGMKWQRNKVTGAMRQVPI